MLEYRKPSCVKEIVIQAELYHQCEKAGLDCDLECSVKILDKLNRNRYELDFVLVEYNQIIAIVEVKNSESDPDRIKNSTQIKQYKQLGIPVFTLYSLYDVPHLVKKLVKIQQEYLKSLEEGQAIFNENEKQSKNRWEEKINIAISEFNKIFTNYEFTNEHSMETIATAVKVLGLDTVLRIINYPNKRIEDFFFYLNSRLDYVDRGRKGTILLNRRKSTIQSVGSYATRLAIIDSKLK